jgi:hypothetical protein
LQDKDFLKVFSHKKPGLSEISIHPSPVTNIMIKEQIEARRSKRKFQAKRFLAHG